MLENLLNLVKELGQDQVVNNPAVPNEHNDAVIAEATHSVASGLQNALANGQGEDVVNLLQGQTNGDVMNNPVAQNMQSSFIDNITSKLGINPSAASGLAASFIPMILNKLIHKTNDPNNSSFDINSIIGSLTGGNNSGGGGIGSLINQFTGGGNNGGGGISSLISQFTSGNGGGGISNLINEFTGGAQQQQAQQGQGGLMDIIKGFMQKNR